jgi:hypothetical protein
MTITLNLKPEVEAGVAAKARASGMTVEEYLLAVVEGAVLPAAQNTLSAEERAAAFEAWAARHRDSTPLSDSAVSREGLYVPPIGTGLGCHMGMRSGRVAGIERLFTLLPDIPAIYDTWKEIVRDH